MIESIALLGRLESQKHNNDAISKLIQPCYNEKAKGAQKLIEINFLITEDGSPVYNEVIVEDLRPEHSKKILYRGGNGNGPNPAPSAFQTKNDTLSIKIFSFFKNATTITELTDEEKQWLNALYTNLQNAEQQIRQRLDQIISNKDKNDSLVLTITFTNNGQTLFLEDMPLFVKLFQYFCQPAKEKVSKGTCSICGKENVEVAPASTNRTYKFFNLDKDGFFWNMLNDGAYTAFPICLDCLQDIEQGKEYIAKELNFRFVEGLSYHLIPQFFTNDEEAVKKFIRSAKNEETQASDLHAVVRQEERVLKNLGELDDTVAVNFLFIDSSSGASAEKISTLIQDVYPSRLKTIYDAKFAVDSMYEKTSPESLPKDGFSFMVVRDFFPRKSKYQKSGAGKKGFNEYFLYVTQSIFENRPLNNDFVYKAIMNRIIEEFHSMLAKEKNAFFLPTVKEAEMLVSFLLELNLLNSRKEETMESDRMFDDYFTQFKDLYGSSLKRGLFLLGAAVRMFVDVQTEGDRDKVAPFLKELKGLRMNLTDFKGLTSKLQNKVFEYSKVAEGWKINRINTVLASATKYLIQVEKAKMSVQEMNFYFVAGYHQGRDLGNYIGNKFKELKESNSKTENEEVESNE